MYFEEFTVAKLPIRNDKQVCFRLCSISIDTIITTVSHNFYQHITFDNNTSKFISYILQGLYRLLFSVHEPTKFHTDDGILFI